MKISSITLMSGQIPVKETDVNLFLLVKTKDSEQGVRMIKGQNTL